MSARIGSLSKLLGLALGLLGRIVGMVSHFNVPLVLYLVLYKIFEEVDRLVRIFRLELLHQPFKSLILLVIRFTTTLGVLPNKFILTAACFTFLFIQFHHLLQCLIIPRQHLITRPQQINLFLILTDLIMQSHTLLPKEMDLPLQPDTLILGQNLHIHVFEFGFGLLDICAHPVHNVNEYLHESALLSMLLGDAELVGGYFTCYHWFILDFTS